MMLDHIIQNNPETRFITATGFDEAIIGVNYSSESPRLVYSVSECLEILTRNSDMSYEDALEFFTFNIEGSYISECQPIFCWDNY